MIINIINLNCGKILLKTSNIVNNIPTVHDIATLQEPNSLPLTSINNHHIIAVQNGRAAIVTLRASIIKTFNIQPESLAAIVNFKGHKILVISVYIPPSHSNHAYDNTITGITKIINGNSNLPVLIAGDVNAVHPSWSFEMYNRPTGKGKTIHSLLSSNHINILNTPNSSNWTFQRPKCQPQWIDIMASNLHKFYSHFTHNTFITNIDNTDHNSITSSIEIRDKIKQDSKQEYFNKRKYFNYIIYTFKQTNITSINDINLLMWKILLKRVKMFYDRSNWKPINNTSIWKNSTIDQNVNKKLKKIAKLQNKERSTLTNEEYLILRKTLIKQMYKGIHEFFKDSKDSKEKWSKINYFLHEHDINLDKIYQENLHSSIGSFDISLEQINQTTEYPPKLNDNTISIESIEKSIKKLNKTATPGLDGINITLINHLIQEDQDKFCKIYSLLFQHCFIPDAWKISYTIFIPKSDGKRPRPISIQSNLSKILEIIIMDNLYTSIPTSFFNGQHAYQPNKSINTALSEIMDPMDAGCPPYMLIVDVESAFDNICHTTIINQLTKLNIDSIIIKLIQAYLADRHMAFYSNDGLKIKSCPNGVPQGSILGPSLYIIGTQQVINYLNNSLLPQPPFFINNKITPDPEKLQVKVSAYADDIIITIPPRPNDKPYHATMASSIIIQLLNLLLKPMNLSILPQKSKLLVDFRAYDKIKKIENLNITVTTSQKILGIEIHLKPPFFLTTDSLLEKIHQTSIRIFTNNSKIIHLPLNVLTLINESKVESLAMTYYNLLFTSLINRKKFRDDLEYYSTYIIRNSCNYDWKVNPLTVSALIGRLPIWAKIIKIKLKEIYNKNFTTDNKFDLDFFQVYPEFAPSINAKAIWWGKNQIINNIIIDFINKHWTEQPQNHYNILGKWNTIASRTRINKLTAMAIDKYEYLYKDKPCYCGSQINEPTHWINQCSLLLQERNDLINQLNIEDHNIISSYLLSKFHYGYNEYLEKVFQTHVLPRLEIYKTEKITQA